MTRYGLTLGLVALVMWAAPAAGASVPANDDIANAVAITLPFSTTVDITNATAAAGDLQCASEGHTVWYRFTPSRTAWVGVITTSASVPVDAVVGTGAPGNLTGVSGCEDGLKGDGAVFQAVAGVTYYVMVGTIFDDAGGPVSVSIHRVTPLVATLTVDPSGTVDHAGVATVSGTLTCNRSARLEYAAGAITQGSDGTASGYFGIGTYHQPCPTAPLEWSGGGYSNTALSFGPGDAVVDASLDVCDAIQCVSSEVTTMVKLHSGAAT